MENSNIILTNKNYWNEHADSWFGVTALPLYGVQCVSETELNLFGDVSDKKMLEIACGSGHSIVYHLKHNVKEIWGIDLSKSQIDLARTHISNPSVKLYCQAMESDNHMPKAYFDTVYSIYGIGWATDLDKVFRNIASYLKEDGIFIFSWKHPLHGCTELVEEKVVFNNTYFDESLKTFPLDGSEIQLHNRKISTYINALIEAGFNIEKLIEETDKETLDLKENMSKRSIKAKQLPLSFIIKARKKPKS